MLLVQRLAGEASSDMSEVQVPVKEHAHKTSTLEKKLKQVGNMWRTTEDIAATWPSILVNLDDTIGLAEFAGPGGWNDPDILEVSLSQPAHHSPIFNSVLIQMHLVQ